MASDGYDKLSDNTRLSFVVVSFGEKTPALLTLKYLNVIIILSRIITLVCNAHSVTGLVDVKVYPLLLQYRYTPK